MLYTHGSVRMYELDSSIVDPHWFGFDPDTAFQIYPNTFGSGIKFSNILESNNGANFISLIKNVFIGTEIMLSTNSSKPVSIYSQTKCSIFFMKVQVFLYKISNMIFFGPDLNEFFWSGQKVWILSDLD